MFAISPIPARKNVLGEFCTQKEPQKNSNYGNINFIFFAVCLWVIMYKNVKECGFEIKQ
jgi:hypothetical protein